MRLRRCWLVLLALCAVGLALLVPVVLRPLPRYAKKLTLRERLRMHTWIVLRGFSYWIATQLAPYGYSPINTTRWVVDNMMTWPGHDDEHIASENLEFDGVRVRVYVPRNRSSDADGPALFFVHGGGWSYMSIDSHDRQVREFVRALGLVAVSVEYRLAPEHPFPAALDDSFAALRYFVRNARRWHVDPSRVLVAGDSAGGHIAAGLGFRWRREVLAPQRANRTDERLPPIRAQLLVYPSVQWVNLSTTSFLANRHDPFLTKAATVRLLSNYIVGLPRALEPSFLRAFAASAHLTRATRERFAPLFEFDASMQALVGLSQLRAMSALRANNSEEHDPEGSAALEAELLPLVTRDEASPLLAASFEDTPQVVLVVAMGNDVLRDDGLLYVKRLRDSGQVKHVDLLYYPHYTHAWLGFDTEARVQKDVARYLREHPDLL